MFGGNDTSKTAGGLLFSLNFSTSAHSVSRVSVLGRSTQLSLISITHIFSRIARELSQKPKVFS